MSYRSEVTHTGVVHPLHLPETVLMGDLDLDRLCRNLGAAVAAAFTTYVIATWGDLGGRQVPLSVAVVAVWVVLAVQDFFDRKVDDVP